MKFKLFIVLMLSQLFTAQVVPADFSCHEKEVSEIKEKISRLNHKISDKRLDDISKSIYYATNYYKISPDTVIALIDTESDFREKMVSRTGDLSLVQINPKVWNKEFLRLKRDQISGTKLMSNESYAIHRMCEILSILKSNYGRDAKWFARYHSNTKKFKLIYHAKVSHKLNLIAAK